MLYFLHIYASRHDAYSFNILLPRYDFYMIHIHIQQLRFMMLILYGIAMIATPPYLLILTFCRRAAALLHRKASIYFSPRHIISAAYAALYNLFSERHGKGKISSSSELTMTRSAPLTFFINGKSINFLLLPITPPETKLLHTARRYFTHYY